MLLVDFPNEETVLERHIYEPNNKQRESSNKHSNSQIWNSYWYTANDFASINLCFSGGSFDTFTS